MPTTAASRKAVNKYMKENYDSLRITTPKGEKLNLQEHAKLMNESLNKFVNRAIRETMQRDREKLV